MSNPCIKCFSSWPDCVDECPKWAEYLKRKDEFDGLEKRCREVIYGESMSDCQVQVDLINEPKAGTKYDQGKPRTDLLPPDALLGAAKVFRFGAAKYGERNWEKGIKNSRLIGSALRHLFSVMKGDLIDSESGLPHIDHALCCVMMLSDNFKNRKEMCNE